MIQAAINQLMGLAAAAKKAEDLTAAKEQRATLKIKREEAAKVAAMQRARDRIESKYNQRSEYQRFLDSLGQNQAPEQLKRIAFEEYQRQKKSSKARR